MSSSEPDERAVKLGRKAARLLRRGRPSLEKAVKDARPRVEKAIADAKPRVEKAAQGAMRYAQEHEDEIKRTALKAARLKVRGPFGFVVDAVVNGMREEAAPPRTQPCKACGTENAPVARFCSQCGANMTVTGTGGK